jgi:hypothetical protein
MGIDIADNYSIIIVQERKGKEMTEKKKVLKLGNSFKEIDILEEPEEPEYRFVLVNDKTGERIDLSTEFVSDYNLDDDGSCPDVWSSDAAQDEALSVLGYSVKIVKN